MGAQITEGLGQAWAMVATFVPKLLGFLLVLVIGWFIAKALAKGVQFLLKRVGFDKLVEKSGLTGAMRQSPMDATSLIAKIVYYFVLLIALQLAFGVFGASNPVSTLLNEVIAYLPRIVVAMVLVIVASAIGTALKGLVTGALGQRSYTKILGNITYGFVMALGIIAALNQLGIAISVTMPVLITVLATIAGVIVIGVGGGLIRPMQQRWEGWLNRMQDEAAAAQSPMPRASQEMPASVGGRSGDAPTPPSGMPMSEK